MEKRFDVMDGAFQGAVKTLDAHFAKADAILQVFCAFSVWKILAQGRPLT